MKKKFWILWGYVANWNETPIEIDAESAEQAVEIILQGYSQDFRNQATVHVFTSLPVLTLKKGAMLSKI